jgi:hypothetical protein
MKFYYDLLPICGIRRLVRRELRQLERGFYGVGLPHPGVECFIGQLNKLHGSQDDSILSAIQAKMTSKIAPSEKFSQNLTELRHRIALSLFQNSY